MKITYNWLKEYVEFPWDWPELLERLTMAGLEREAVEDLGERFRGVVVGRVVERAAHPQAERLSVCRVDLGEEVVPIVCGAPNVAAGQKVAVALPGCRLAGGTEIHRARIRGVESAGMICSEVELGLGEDAAGIMVLPDSARTGASLAAQLGLEDLVLDFEVTPNRPDWLSVFGIAREVGALAGTPAVLPPYDPPEAGPPTGQDIRVEIEDPDSCPRYVARVIRGVRVGPSPDWLQRRLQAVGLRPINNVVDITNYVLVELGQPLHAFDLRTLAEARIVVRRARPGESLGTLDGIERRLDSEVLVIADGSRPVALAGIMGGSRTQVREETRDLLLESAYFAPARVRLGSSRVDLHTEASARFERGVDWDLARLASDRATRLIVELAGGEAAPAPVDAFPRPLTRRQIRLRLSRLNSLLGTELEADSARRILVSLGCHVNPLADPALAAGEGTGELLQVTAPSFRPDLEREVDLIEEVGRVYGYQRIPSSPSVKGPLGAETDPLLAAQRRTRHRLSGLGLDEVVTNSIVEQRWLEAAGLAGPPLLTLSNPPTEAQGVLRPTLVPSLLDAARRNFNQRAATVAVYELGKCFGPVPGGERVFLSGLWAGWRSASTWRADQQEVEFADVKGLLEVLLQGMDPRFAPVPAPPLAQAATATDAPRMPAPGLLFRAGHCAEIRSADQLLGYLGQCAPSVAAAFDIDRAVYIFELDFESLAELWARRPLGYRPLPKFPPLERDLALVLPEATGMAEVVEQIRLAEPVLVEQVDLFDCYRGDQIPAGHKSLAFTIRLRSAERTLADRQADQVVEAVVRRLAQAFGATLR